MIGFFVCGFHLAFINVHMPAYLVQCGLSPEVGSWTIAVIGLFNIVGSLLAGYLGGRLPKQMLLATIYFSRAVAIGLFLLFPVSEVTAYAFAAAMGLLWLSTVPLTAGLVSLFFGARYMGMLYGVAFLSHQIGSFVGVWLGGYVYDQTGSYSLVWYLGILLGLGSAAIHLPDQRAQRAQLRAQAGLTSRIGSEASFSADQCLPKPASGFMVRAIIPAPAFRGDFPRSIPCPIISRGCSRAPNSLPLMAALMALNALAIDVMLPALPYMGEALGVTSENERQFVISRLHARHGHRRSSPSAR